MQTSGARKLFTGHSRAVLEHAWVGAIYINMVVGSLVQVVQGYAWKPEVNSSSPQQEQKEKREEKKKNDKRGRKREGIMKIAVG